MERVEFLIMRENKQSNRDSIVKDLCRKEGIGNIWNIYNISITNTL